MEATGPIIHHYVSRFLLRRFADPKTGLLWAYEKGTGRSWQCNPKQVAAERRYYAFTGEDGKPDNAVEDALSKLEGEVSPIIERVERDLALPSPNERAVLALFIALSVSRVPSFRKPVERFYGEVARKLSLVMAHHKEYFYRVVGEAERARGQKFDTPVEQVRQAVLNGDLAYEGSPFASLEMMLETSPQIAEIIHQMRWQFLHAPAGVSFITSDRPVVWVNPKLPPHPVYGNPGLAQKDILLLFPIGPRVCFLARWEGEEGHFGIKSNGVIQINQPIIGYARKYVFSLKHSQEIETLAEKIKGDG